MFEIMKALLIMAGVVTAIFRGPLPVKIIMIRFGFIIDAIITILLVVMAAGSGSKYAVATMMLLGFFLSLLMVFARFTKEHQVETEWSQKKDLNFIPIMIGAIVLAIPFFIISKPVGMIVLLSGLVTAFTLKFGLRKKTDEELKQLKENPELFYIRINSWKNILSRKTKKTNYIK